MKQILRGAGALLFYLFLVIFPLLMGALYDPAPAARPFTLELAVAAGYVGLALMALQFALVTRLSIASGAFGQDALQQFHRQMSYVATLFIFAHPVLLSLNGFDWNTLMNPFNENPWALKWGTITIYALVFVILLSVGRKKIHLPYGWWQWTHAILATVAVAGGIYHIFGVANYTGMKGMRVLWWIYAGGLGALFLRYRILIPLAKWRHPWEVVRNVEELGHARTLVLKPVGHDGLTFEPGQFAWIMTGWTPFALEQHPISFSSSAEISGTNEISFTIKSLGNWSRDLIPAIQPGKRVWLDGPYGVFSPDHEQGPGYVLIGGGVGITPLYSMVRTLVDREDVRPVTLIYGAREWDEITFRDELAALARKQPNLKIVYVLEKPPEGWTGETGFITADILRRHLPKQYRRYPFFVCGPIPLMDLMEDLLPELGVPAEHLHTERFDIV